MTTFSRDAAEEMARRLVNPKKVGLKPAQVSRITIGTFHSLGLRQLRTIGRAGKVVSDVEARHLVFKALVGSGSHLPFDEAEAAIALFKSDPAYAAANPEHKALVAAYRQQLDAIGANDFADMLILANQLMDSGDLAPIPATHIMADEFQDIDRVQYEWLMKHIGQKGHPVATAVGDDDQSIYGFRRSLGFRGMRDFVADTGADIIHLDTNYRSTAGILDSAGQLIAYNIDRVNKKITAHRGPGPSPTVLTLNKEDNLGNAIVRLLHERLKGREVPPPPPGRPPYRYAVNPGEIAILARTNRALVDVETALIKAGIPYLRLGRSIWDVESIQVYIAVLDALASRKSVGLEIALRWAGTPNGVVARLAAAAGGEIWNYIREVDPVCEADDESSIVRSFFHHGRTAWVSCLTGTGSAQKAPMVINGVVGWMISVLSGACELDEEGHPIKTEAAGRDATTVNQLTAVQSLLLRNRGSLLQRIRKAQERDNRFDRVIVCSFHGSKGMEWEHVYLIDVHGGAVPKIKLGCSEQEVCEERRVFYVAMTRAADTLTIFARDHRPVSEFLIESGLWEDMQSIHDYAADHSFQPSTEPVPA